jgi:hypothetical protein
MVVLHRQYCGLYEMVVADERLDGTDMVRQLFGKRSCMDSHNTWRGDHERRAGAGEASDPVNASSLEGFGQVHGG